MANTPARLPEDTMADIQGFVTSGYGHLPLARYLFLQVHDPARGRQYLAGLLPRVTTGATWPKVHGKTLKPSSALNIAFTCEGLEALGVPEAVRCTFPEEFQEGIASPRRSAILGDTEGSAPAAWEFGGSPASAIHVVVIIHAASSGDLERECSLHDALVGAAAGGVTMIGGQAQDGYRPENGHEPFGFRDGIAQPPIKGIPDDGVPTGEFILGYENHYGFLPPTPVVPEELPGSGCLAPLDNPYHEPRGRDLGVNGSFVAYRKLQQDVAGFWRFMQREAVRATGRADAEHMVWVASRLVGRWPGGAPLTVSPDRDDPRLADHDEFLYENDVDGLACPLGAHVRRTNPRAMLKPYGIKESLSMTEAHRLLRRGRVYGPPMFDASVLHDAQSAAAARAILDLQDDGAARGIHFFCVNASIKSQFEFVQQSWCNNPRFGGLTVNRDPVTGNCAGTGDPPSHMEIPKRPTSYRTAALPRFVTVRAGAYLFMPSIRALRFLSAAAPGITRGR